MDKIKQIVLKAKKQILDINRLGLEPKMYEDVINEAIQQALTIHHVSDTLILTPKDAEVFFNEIMNPKDANEALKKAMLKFINR